MTLHARLAALEAKATPAPWRADSFGYIFAAPDENHAFGDNAFGEFDCHASAHLAVATRNALPAIMRILAAAEAIAEVHASSIGLGPCMCHVCHAVRAANEVTR